MRIQVPLGPPQPPFLYCPITLSRVPNIRLDTWAYRLLRNLQVNCSNNCLVHQPYYHPFSVLDSGYTLPPFLTSADHLFKWRIPPHQYPITVVVISINPLCQFLSPHVININHLLFSCPTFFILHWDCPQYLPVTVTELLYLQEEQLQEDSLSFITELEVFCTAYYTPISPTPPPFLQPLT